jgi:hypothetical protein
MLQSYWLETQGGRFGGKGPIISGEKVAVDLPLDLGKVHGKFGDASYYRDRMHKEQTNKQTSKQTFFFIYRDIDR